MSQRALEYIDNCDIKVMQNVKFGRAVDYTGKVINWALLYNKAISHIAENYSFSHAFLIDSDEFYLGPSLRDFKWVENYAATIDRIACFKMYTEVAFFSERDLIRDHEFVLARFFNVKTGINYHFSRPLHPFIVNNNDELMPPDAFLPATILHFNSLVNSEYELNQKKNHYNQIYPELNDINTVLNGLCIDHSKALSNSRLEQIAQYYGNICLKSFKSLVGNIIRTYNER
jgi:hypothetical protein